MARWYEGPLVAFEAEATGVDAERDRITGAAVAAQDGPGSPVTTRSWTVAPGGIGRGHRPGQVADALVRALAERSAAGTPLVVLNAPFALTLLDRELRRHLGGSLCGELRRSALCVLDPLVLDRHLDRPRPGRRTRAALCAHYGVDPAPGGGPAGAAGASLALARALGRHFAPRTARYSAAELHALQAVWYASRARGLASWASSAAEGHPVHPAWPLRPALPA